MTLIKFNQAYTAGIYINLIHIVGVRGDSPDPKKTRLYLTTGEVIVDHTEEEVIALLTGKQGGEK